jgi:hypothetical protein
LQAALNQQLVEHSWYKRDFGDSHQQAEQAEERPQGAPAEPETQRVIRRVMGSFAYQTRLLEMVGVHGYHLGAISSGWRRAVASRREQWRLLTHDYTGSRFGGGGADGGGADGPGQLNYPCALAILPEAAVCVVDSMNDRLQIYNRGQQMLHTSSPAWRGTRPEPSPPHLRA